MTTIAYVTIYDSSDINAWSGTGYNMSKMLEDAGYNVVRVGSLKTKVPFYLKLKQKIYSKLFSKKYSNERVPAVLKSYAKEVEEALALIDYDVIFSPGSLPVTYIDEKKPIVFWTDATFASMIDFYPGFTNLSNEAILNGKEEDQLILSKCSLAIYASEWAKNSAIENYNVNPNKIKVIPFGANIKCDRTLDDVVSNAKSKSLDMCKLLFVGVEWERKGGDIAVKVAEELNRQGLTTELHIVGCTPPSDTPDFVKLHGFVSKKTEEGRKLLDNLFSSSHFFILPSEAECFGIVFSEASSFGLPSLATDVGGIPTAITNDKNGFIFSLNSDPKEYCNYIMNTMSSEEKYVELAKSSFLEYSQRLNWISAGQEIKNEIDKLVGKE